MSELKLVVMNGADIIGTSVLRQDVTKPNIKTGKGGGKPCWKAEIAFVPPARTDLRVTLYANGIGYDPEIRAAKTASAFLRDMEHADPAQLAEIEAKLAELRG